MLPPVEPREITEYGYKRPGRSCFVVVAPHAAGDDLHTDFLARRLARRLEGSLVVNKKYFKPTNSQAQEYPEQVEDFNKLSWSNKKQKYRWKHKVPAMKKFFQDIGSYCESARIASPEGKAIVLYIHSLKPTQVAMDIGVGLRAKRGNFRFHGSARSGYACTGVPTIPISKVKELTKVLTPIFKKRFELDTVIGRKFPSWSRRVAVQWHKTEGRDDYAIQFEINYNLKDTKDKVRYLTRLLNKVLRQIFV